MASRQPRTGKWRLKNSGTGGVGDVEVLEREKVEKMMMMGMTMDGINTAVYQTKSRRTIAWIVINGASRIKSLMVREY